MAVAWGDVRAMIWVVPVRATATAAKPPTVTVAPGRKFVPLIVRLVPPAAVPPLGALPVTVGGGASAARPILLALDEDSVNQRLPPGPAAMPNGPLFAVGVAYSVMAPAVVTRPILPTLSSVNQRLPSGPAAMPYGPLLAVGVRYSVTAPPGVMRPILLLVSLGEPEVAVRPRRDADRAAERGRDGILGDRAGSGNPADPFYA